MAQTQFCWQVPEVEVLRQEVADPQTSFVITPTPFHRAWRHGPSAGLARQQRTRPVDLSKECLHLLKVLLARLTFNGTADINGVRPHLEDGFGDVFRREPTRQNDPAMLLGLHSNVPIKGLSSSAQLFCVVRIQKIGTNSKRGQLRQIKSSHSLEMP